MRATWIFQVGPRVDNNCLFQRGAEKQRQPSEDGGEGWSCAATNQGMPGATKM